ncbi:hypothetical protein [Saccharothrix ecbatanensis]|uniref:hypothetical protein n=1 Tax=Saccharothrix ecbatanensis TaxID=1105145 RepID=UPI0016101FF6|nr:hypothetical protein [Saccharothrix ecbatanensis]
MRVQVRLRPVDDVLSEQAAHSGRQPLLVAGWRGPSAHLGLHPLGRAVMQREHVVLGGPDEELALRLVHRSGCSWARSRAPVQSAKPLS